MREALGLAPLRAPAARAHEPREPGQGRLQTTRPCWYTPRSESCCMRAGRAGKSPRSRLEEILARPDREVNLAEAALLVAAEEYPDLDVRVLPGAPRRDGRRAAPPSRRRAAPRARDHGPQPLPLPGAGLPRQHRAVLRRAEQLPERGARPRTGHPDHALDRLHGGRAARRARGRGRRAARPLRRARADCRPARCSSTPSTAARS